MLQEMSGGLIVPPKPSEGSIKKSVFLAIFISCIVAFLSVSVIPRSIRTYKVSKVLNENIVSCKSDTVEGQASYEALTQNYRIQIYEKFPVPFQSKRETDFWVIDINGDIVVSNTFSEPYNSKELINKIENYAIKTRNIKKCN